MLKEILKNSSGVPTGEYKDIAGGTLYADSPLGTILPFGGTTAPSGWMICNGASLLRTDYAELFAIIGTAFGSADSTHFNIPDLRGEFLRGAGTNSHSGQGNGGSVGTHQDSTAIQNQIAEQNTHRLVIGFGAGNINMIKNSEGSTKEGLTGNAYMTNNQEITSIYTPFVGVRPTNTSVNYIIKAKMVALPADLDSAVDAKIAAKGVYSTSEVDTGKTWIDGKKIYRKVVEFGTLPNTTTKAVAHGITNIGTFVHVSGFCIGQSNEILPIPLAWPTATSIIGIYATTINVIVNTAMDRTNYTGYVILEYTKTT